MSQNVSPQTIFTFFERKIYRGASFTNPNTIIRAILEKKERKVARFPHHRKSCTSSSFLPFFNVVQTNRGEENWPGFRGHVITAYDSLWHTRLFGKDLAKKNAGNSGNVGHHGFPKYGGAIIIGRTHDL